MGWLGDPCWYCGADLYEVLDQEHSLLLDPETSDLDPRSFEWHMVGHCMDKGWIRVDDNGTERQQAARLLENLHERHTGKMTRR